MGSDRERKSFSLAEVKDLGSGKFEGLGSVYGNVDLGGDVVEPGAFTKTLRENGNRVPILWQHQTDEPIGLAMLSDSNRGLVVKGELDLEIDTARRAYSGLKRGYLRGLSIGYSTAMAAKRTSDGARRLLEIKLYEISLVTFPMNEEALVSSVKAGEHDLLAAHLRATTAGIQGLLRDLRGGRV